MPQGLLSLLIETTTQLVTLALFGLGLGVWITRRLKLPPVFLPALTLGSAFLQAYVLFYVWFFSARAATHLTRAVLVASLALAWSLLRSSRSDFLRREPAVVIAQMLVLAYAFLLILGAMPAEPRVRFHVPLAIDHLLPRLLADRFYFERFEWVWPQPPLGHDYLASDRPPLQATIVLVLRVLLPAGPDVAYQVTGTLCQMGWVPALYALAATYRLRREQRAFLLIGTACSGFALLNSVYTWPKLMAGWLVVLAVAVAFYDDDEPRARPLAWRLGAAAALVALGLLAHSSPVFSIVTAPLLLFTRRGRPYRRMKTLLVAAAVGLATLSPWLAYTRFVDPPGTRLVKMHLGGVAEVDPRGAFEAIRDRYAAATAGELLWARVTNFGEQWLTRSGRSDFVPWLQWQQFFHIIPTLGAFSIGLLVLLVRHRALPDAVPDDWDVWQLFLYVLATWVLWILVMFVPNTAILHHSSYANLLLLFLLGSLGLTLLPPTVARVLLALHVALFGVGWLQLLGPWIGVRLVWLDLGAAVLALFGVIAWTIPPQSSNVPPSVRRD